MATEPERVILTYDDLLQLPEDCNRYELFEGELSVTAAPNDHHQDVVGNLYVILRPHVRARRLGRLFVAPIHVKFSDVSVVEPDLVFVRRENLGITQGLIVGVPDLVVEVLSPSTGNRDRRTKRAIYARTAVPSYWIVDPDAETIETLRLVGTAYQVVERAAPRDARRRTVLRAHDSFRGSLSDVRASQPFPNLQISLARVWG